MISRKYFKPYRFYVVKLSSFPDIYKHSVHSRDSESKLYFHLRNDISARYIYVRLVLPDSSLIKWQKLTRDLLRSHRSL